MTSEGEIKYIRLLRINKGSYPASSYKDFVGFINEIEQADEYKMVLKKK